MKDFETLTEAELVDLSKKPEEVRRYVDYLCAENGVPLLPALLPEPEMNFPEPDTTVWGLKIGYRETDFFFFAAADAAAVIDVMQRKALTTLDYLSTPRPDSDSAISPRGDVNVEMISKKVYSRDLAVKSKEVLAAAKREKDLFEANKKKYDEAVTARRRFEEFVDEKITEAVEAVRTREEMEETFARYVALAEGNQRMGWRFLVKANPDAAKILPEVAEMFGGPQPVSGGSGGSGEDKDIPF